MPGARVLEKARRGKGRQGSNTRPRASKKLDGSRAKESRSPTRTRGSPKKGRKKLAKEGKKREVCLGATSYEKEFADHCLGPVYQRSVGAKTVREPRRGGRKTVAHAVLGSKGNNNEAKKNLWEVRGKA